MVVVTTFAFYHTMGPQSPIFALNYYSRDTEFLGSILVFLILCLPFYYHFMIFIIMIYTNWWSINYWHYTSNWAVGQHCCWIRESLFPVKSFISATELCMGHSWNQNISVVCTLQILYMLPPAHYFVGDMMMKMSV